MFPESVTDWVCRVVGRNSRIRSIIPLPGWSPTPPWLLCVDTAPRTVHVVLRTDSTAGRHSGYAREIQALTVAERHGLAAPRLLAADLDGTEAGQPSTLVTALPGWSSPTISDPSPLKAYGSAVASVGVASRESGDLVRLSGPIDVDHAAADRRLALQYEAGSERERAELLDAFCAQRRIGRAAPQEVIVAPPGGRSELLESAEVRISRLPEPPGESVLVHGDLHLGNTMWIGPQVTGMVDWDASGVGHAGIDLGLARFDAALHVDLEPARAAEHVLAGWREITGWTPDPGVVAYWDVRAALNAPVTFGPPTQDQPARRDAFLRAALRDLA